MSFRVAVHVSSGAGHTLVILLHHSRVQASGGTLARHSAPSLGPPDRMPILTYTTRSLHTVKPCQSLEG